MRTTLSLDADVAARIRQLRRKGATLREIVNTALRRGLSELEHPQRPKRVRTRAVSLGPLSSNIDDVAEVLALAEGDDYR
jgi:hypothetical protein